MSKQHKAVTNYRRRMKRQGIFRVEVHVRKDDVLLVRSVAQALCDPEHATDVRALLRDGLGARKSKGLKALLAAAPLEGIDLSRARDLGRDVDL